MKQKNYLFELKIKIIDFYKKMIYFISINSKWTIKRIGPRLQVLTKSLKNQSDFFLHMNHAKNLIKNPNLQKSLKLLSSKRFVTWGKKSNTSLKRNNRRNKGLSFIKSIVHQEIHKLPFHNKFLSEIHQFAPTLQGKCFVNF